VAVRHRFLVALVPAQGLLDGLRVLTRVVGGPPDERIPPHVTLVPPFNLPESGVAGFRAALRSAAASAVPFELRVGPGASFAPANPTLHLGVGGEAPALASLAALRESLRVPPMDRPDRHPFVPHVTLRRGAPEAVISAVAELLPGDVGPWRVDRLVVLQQLSTARGMRWVPVAEEPFGGPVVVGRGGVELALRTVGVPEPLWSDSCGLGAVEPEDADGNGADDVLSFEGLRSTLAVVAEPSGRPGEVIARAVGRLAGPVAELSELEVASDHRRMGVARQVLARWCADAASAGARLALVSGEPGGVLGALGFSPLGDHLVRQLAPPPG
jgi:2'-5' RNA ligase/GNAT superfamily N-acetyltransferase